MNKNNENIYSIEFKKLVFLKITFLLLTILTGILYLSLSTGGLTNNAVTWILLKVFVALFVGGGAFFCLMYITNLLPIDGSISEYVRFYKKHISKVDIENKIGLFRDHHPGEAQYHFSPQFFGRNDLLQVRLHLNLWTF